MKTSRSSINEDAHFRTLKLLEEKPGISQRALDKEAGMSVRGVNYFISALAAKG